MYSFRYSLLWFILDYFSSTRGNSDKIIFSFRFRFSTRKIKSFVHQHILFVLFCTSLLLPFFELKYVVSHHMISSNKHLKVCDFTLINISRQLHLVTCVSEDSFEMSYTFIAKIDLSRTYFWVKSKIIPYKSPNNI